MNISKPAHQNICKDERKRKKEKMERKREKGTQGGGREAPRKYKKLSETLRQDKNETTQAASEQSR